MARQPKGPRLDDGHDEGIAPNGFVVVDFDAETCVGPFDTYDAASTWADKYDASDALAISPVLPPTAQVGKAVAAGAAALQADRDDADDDLMASLLGGTGLGI